MLDIILDLVVAMIVLLTMLAIIPFVCVAWILGIIVYTVKEAFLGGWNYFFIICKKEKG